MNQVNSYGRVPEPVAYETTTASTERYTDSVRGDMAPSPGLILGPQTKYRIDIETLDHGYIVRVGCKTFAIETKEDLISKLASYLADPVGVENKFNRGELFK